METNKLKAGDVIYGVDTKGKIIQVHRITKVSKESALSDKGGVFIIDKVDNGKRAKLRLQTSWSRIFYFLSDKNWDEVLENQKKALFLKELRWDTLSNETIDAVFSIIKKDKFNDDVDYDTLD